MRIESYTDENGILRPRVVQDPEETVAHLMDCAYVEPMSREEIIYGRVGPRKPCTCGMIKYAIARP